MARDVSEREFVNYAKGLGDYCAYTDTRIIVAATLRALSEVFGAGFELDRLLPPGVRTLLPPEGNPVSYAGDGSQVRRRLLERVTELADLTRPASAEHALRTVLGTIKEKSQDRLADWDAAMPPELREDWSRSVTIERQQDAGQCL